MKTSAWWLGIVLGTANFYALAETEIITLNSNMANDMLPVVRNLLEPGGNVSVFQGKLVINSSAQNITNIKNVLSTLDKPAKQLLISVRQGSVGTQTSKGYSGEGEIQVNPNVTITHKDGTVSKKIPGQTTISSDSARINIVDNKTSTTDDSSQRVRAIEGYPAHIYIGQQVPVVNTSHDNYGRKYQDITYKDVNQGFYVTANLIGDGQVQIEVQTENDKLNSDRQKIIENDQRNHINSNRDNTIIDTQHSATTTAGRLGEWISLGGVDQSGTQNTSAYLSKGKQTKQVDNSIYIKIDLVE